jgi:hypothetical protein
MPNLFHPEFDHDEATFWEGENPPPPSSSSQ